MHSEGVWGFGKVIDVKYSTSTTNDVVRDIIIPETAAEGCCYADKFPGGPQTPNTLMSHWWGNTFISLVKVLLHLMQCFSSTFIV
jgi:hypothetical protein